MRLGSLSFVLCGVLLVSPACAADPVGDRFSAIDNDKDGRICWDEFCVVNPNISRKGFDSMDLNKDENLSMEEWQVFYENHGMSVPGQTSSSMMPAQPASAPRVMPPAKPGANAPANPAEVRAEGTQAPAVGKMPTQPSPPKIGGMPLLSPPTVKAPVSPTVQTPHVPAVNAPKVTAVAPVRPTQSSGNQATPSVKSLGDMPLLSPPKNLDPKAPEKTHEVRK